MSFISQCIHFIFIFLLILDHILMNLMNRHPIFILLNNLLLLRHLLLLFYYHILVASDISQLFLLLLISYSYHLLVILSCMWRPRGLCHFLACRHYLVICSSFDFALFFHLLLNKHLLMLITLLINHL